ncbi:Putative zinc-finger [Lachnospiraceae bacterium KH1T2]|nr:Putative zinc-finger [Lachnospiraceae bacterium KH1T2]
MKKKRIDGAEVKCKEAENLIQPFLDNKLNIDDMKLLYGHIQNCHDCYDELEIRYLLNEGIKRIEDGEALDLKKELDEKLYHARQRILLADRMQNVIFLGEALALLLTAVNIIISHFE